MTPVGASRRASSTTSARKRAAGTMTGTPSGIGASSRIRKYRSATMRAALTSGIDSLLEWFDADAFDRIEKNLVRPLTQLQVGSNNVFDDVRHFGIRHRRTDQRAKLGILVGAPADGHLEVFLAVLLDAKEADVTDVVVAAGIDATRDVDMEPAKIAGQIKIAETSRELLRHRNRARVGKAAVIETGAGDDVGDEPDIRSR